MAIWYGITSVGMEAPADMYHGLLGLGLMGQLCITRHAQVYAAKGSTTTPQYQYCVLWMLGLSVVMAVAADVCPLEDNMAWHWFHGLGHHCCLVPLCARVHGAALQGIPRPLCPRDHPLLTNISCWQRGLSES